MWEFGYFNFVSPDYSVVWEFPANFEVLETDIVLVYMLWGEDNFGDDIWKPLPATVILDGGIINYSFDFTRFDVQIDMRTTNAAYFNSDWANGWVARIVLIPANWADAHPDVDLQELEYGSLVDKLRMEGVENIIHKDIRLGSKAVRNRF